MPKDEVLGTLRKVFDAEERAVHGGKYDEVNPAYYARRYVQDAVWTFVEHQAFRALSISIRLFQESGAPRSDDLRTLATACERLSIEAEVLRSAGSSESAGRNTSLASFLDSVIRVEELASRVSDLTTQLLPDLRSVPGAVAAAEN
jgi:hypothetical protein